MKVSQERKQEILRRHAAGQSASSIARAMLLSPKAVQHAITRHELQSRKHCGATVAEVVEGQGCGLCVVCQATKERYAQEIARRRAAHASGRQTGPTTTITSRHA